MAVRTRTKYEANDGSIHAIQLTAKVAAVTGNAAPTGDVNTEIKAKVSKSNREYGIRPRGARISLVKGTAPDQFTVYAFIPILDPTNYGTGNFQTDGDITYDGATWKVVSLVPEDY